MLAWAFFLMLLSMVSDAHYFCKKDNTVSQNICFNLTSLSCFKDVQTTIFLTKIETSENQVLKTEMSVHIKPLL